MPQRRHVALRVDAQEVLAGRGLLRPEIDPLGLERDAGFVERDVDGHRARARGIVELHVQLLMWGCKRRRARDWRRPPPPAWLSRRVLEALPRRRRSPLGHQCRAAL
jgi:hypothetical protein